MEYLQRTPTWGQQGRSQEGSEPPAPSLAGSHRQEAASLLCHHPYLGIQTVQEGTLLMISYPVNDYLGDN